MRREDDFLPRRVHLACEYCESRQAVSTPADQAGLSEGNSQDFILGLATAKGHLAPVAMHSITCQGCGAVFIAPPQKITFVCPYCNSAEVLEEKETKEWVAPSALIPFKFSKENQKEIMESWVSSDKNATRPTLRSIDTIYLPVWIINMGGLLNWTAERKPDDSWGSGESEEWVRESGSRIVDLVMPVLASHRLPQPLTEIVDEFDLKSLVPYDPAYLANLAAATYQIPLNKASLIARQKTVERETYLVFKDSIHELHNLQLTSAGLTVNSYQLVLLPVYTNKMTADGDSWIVRVNGQTGAIKSEKPAKEGWWKWLTGMFK